MTQEPQTIHPYDEWLTGELSRLRATGRGEPPKIVLIAGLRKHAGLGLREAKEVVEDYGQRCGLAWEASGIGPAASVLWMATLLLLAVVSGHPLLRALLQNEKLGLGSAAVSGLVTAAFLTLLALEIGKYLRTRQSP
jgi:hypothetical protein